MGKKRIKVQFEISQRSLQEGGYDIFKTYREIATMELAKAIQPRILPVTNERKPQSHCFEAEIEIDKKFLKKEYI